MILGGFCAEMRKLWRPLLLWLTLGAIALVALFAAMSQEPDHTYIGNLRQGEVDLHAHPPSASDLGVPTGAKYDKALAEVYRDAHQQTRDALAQAVVVGATQHPAGALGLAARLMASTLGALIMFIIAGAHTGGEWTLRTLKDVLARDPRRYRFVLLKIGSLWAAGLWLVVCAWLGLVVMGLVTRHVWPLPQPSSQATTWLWAARQLLRALPVLLLYATVGVCLSVLVRNPLGALFGGLILIVACGFASRFDAIERAVPVVWVGTWMRFRAASAPESYLLDHPLSANESVLIGPLPSLVGIVLLAGVVAVVSVAAMKLRRDILL
jgi:hypothetical protein